MVSWVKSNSRFSGSVQVDRQMRQRIKKVNLIDTWPIRLLGLLAIEAGDSGQQRLRFGLQIVETLSQSLSWSAS